MLDYKEAYSYMILQNEQFIIETYPNYMVIASNDDHSYVVSISQTNKYKVIIQKIEPMFFSGSYNFSMEVTDSTEIDIPPIHMNYVQQCVIDQAEKLLEFNYDSYINKKRSKMKIKNMRKFAKKGM